MGGVEEALDDDVIDDGAAGVWCEGSGDELLCAVAVAPLELMFEDIVEDDEDDDGKIWSAWLPLSDTGPFVWSSIMWWLLTADYFHFFIAVCILQCLYNVSKKKKSQRLLCILY
jgi:hypothetical protein